MLSLWAIAVARPSAITSLPSLSHAEIRRYSRHLILDDVGVEGQRRLKAARVLCVGSGGLGSPALVYLAAAGVGTLGVVDNDVVDESNLQRQIIHATDAVGSPKVDSAAQRVGDLNPLVKLVKHEELLTAENALRILGEYDIVVDGSDNFPTRYLVNDACVLLGLPLVYGAVQKFEGQISLFNLRLPDGSRGPNYRDLFPEPPPPGAVPSCAEGGVLGVLPGVIGTMQATEAIKLAIGVGERAPRDTLSGRLLLYNAMSFRFHEVALKPRPNAAPIRELIDYTGFCGQAAAEEAQAAARAAERFARITPLDANERMQGGWEPFVLDVRTAREAEVVSLPRVGA
mmetsp:Transcript_23089/g.73890  ORF Transcript_23089/g.73890 Transcript_23089/m.73890 type:complete len:343 (+) Transcript_23089:24-1052(+)